MHRGVNACVHMCEMYKVFRGRFDYTRYDTNDNIRFHFSQIPLSTTAFILGRDLILLFSLVLLPVSYFVIFIYHVFN